MNRFVILMFSVLQHLWTPINADDVPIPPNLPILGKSPCMYSSSFDPNGYYCPVASMPVSFLPIECSSFIYDGIICDENVKINSSGSDIVNMNNLRSSGKKLYVDYSHGYLQSWMQAIDPSMVPNEAAELTTFLSSNLVEGLILKDLNYIYNGGEFAKEQLHAQRIITKYIDTIDPTTKCECDSRNQFIAFKMLLRGFSKANRITDCSKLNIIAAEEPSCLPDSTTPAASPGNSYLNSLNGYFSPS